MFYNSLVHQQHIVISSVKKLYLLIYNCESFSEMTAGVGLFSETRCLVEEMRSCNIISGSTCRMCCCIGTWVLTSVAVTLLPTGHKTETPQNSA